jgi:CheY-like chemotaxis protein
MLDPVDPRSADAAPQPAALPAASPADVVAPRALLVDDEPVIRQALRRFFVRQGWTVDEAENGTEALGHLLGDAAHGRVAGDYAVIISDLRMPGVSGIELHARLAAERPELLDRLILSTGDSVSLEAADFLRRARCPVLNKPFELAELRAMVARVRAAAADAP